MKIREQITIKKEITKSLICDVCSKEYTFEDNLWEAQEFAHIDFMCGYGSIFGDGNRFECDICQHCLKTLLEGKYRITNLTLQ